MKFIADLHIHSKYSRATARLLDLEHLYMAAQLKGITVIGTGDFTHPGWFAEISEKLVPAEAGLFKLAPDIAKICDRQVPRTCRQKVRFVLTAEISNIYKKQEKTRKNHNLVFVPDLDTADAFIQQLDKIGNIRSDGRPILGLDARDLLEIVLETGNDGFLIPAHIWTPWFSLLGSKSGFDSVGACFEDLTDHIFAVETGLSSDPPMNWRVSGLDGLTLVSNSDAHSPQKLGREANLFDTELSYSGIRSAMKSGDPARFLGTIEFYPEEGKYHLDGHRKCDVRLWPSETAAEKGICPACGKPVTCGVLYRVEELADRPQGAKPDNRHPFCNLIPLKEILAEIFSVGPATKRVARSYDALLEHYGPELTILRSIPPADLDQSGIPLLGTAIERVRQNNIEIVPGYDGEFGRIKIFTQSERKQISGQRSLFSMPAVDPVPELPENQKNKPREKSEKNSPLPGLAFTLAADETKQAEGMDQADNEQFIFDKLLDGLNPQQRRAVGHKGGPMLIVAGPGTGKTRTLTHRIAHLIARSEVSSEKILAVTFTNKASQEMRRRLHDLLDKSTPLPAVHTFHAFCLGILTAVNTDHPMSIIDDIDRNELMAKAVQLTKLQGVSVSQRPGQLCEQIVFAKQQIQSPEDFKPDTGDPETAAATAAVYRNYQQLLSTQHLYDYEDLIFEVVRLLETNDTVRHDYQQRYKFILVDEYQDLNYGQYRLIKALSPPGKDLFVIGDPDQAIYGFRGSDVKYFTRFVNDYPDAKVVRLERNYRSNQTILNASHQLIAVSGGDQQSGFERSRIYSGIDGIKTIGIFETASEKAEAVAVGKTIEKMIGGIGFYSIDFGKTEDFDDKKGFGFSDFAVLYRAGFQGQIIAETLEKAGIPCQITDKKSVLNKKGCNILLSYLKIVEGAGAYLDLARMLPYTDFRTKKHVLAHFIDWGIQHHFSLGTALHHIHRFPVPGIAAEDQRKLVAFDDSLADWRESMRRHSVREKLQHISGKLNQAYINDYGDPTDQEENFMNRVAGGDGNTCAFISNMALQSDPDLYDSTAQKVALLTLHAAKGLEFPVVFVTGCETGLMPFRTPGGQVQNAEEERRLLYVAMTRAKDILYLTYALKRRRFGNLEQSGVSPFLKDIESRLQKIERCRKKTLAKNDSGQVQLKLFG